MDSVDVLASVLAAAEAREAEALAAAKAAEEYAAAHPPPAAVLQQSLDASGDILQSVLDAYGHFVDDSTAAAGDGVVETAGEDVAVADAVPGAVPQSEEDAAAAAAAAAAERRRAKEARLQALLNPTLTTGLSGEVLAQAAQQLREATEKNKQRCVCGFARAGGAIGRRQTPAAAFEFGAQRSLAVPRCQGQ